MNERVMALLKHPVTIPASVGIVSFAGGLGLGYLFGKRKKEAVQVNQYFNDDIVVDFEVEGLARDQETQQATHIITEEAYYSPAVVPEVEEEAVMAPEAEATIDTVEVIGDGYDKEPVEAAEPDDELIEITIVEEYDEDWDWEVELAERREKVPGEPYLLHRDEFWRDEMNFAQMSLRYFEGDDFMVDEDDDPVNNWPAICGELKFGHGATDPNVCYIRNEDRRAEYEVTREEGTYSQEILGIHIEDNARVQDLRHSHRPGKFRMD